MRSGRLALACALCVLATGLLPAAAPARQPEPAADASVFRIQAVDAQRRVAWGTAVMVAARTLVTNCHVVQGAHEITVVTTPRNHVATLLRADVEHDLCLLAVSALDAPVVALGNTVRLRPGASIAAAGFSGPGALAWSSGRIEGLFAYRGRGRVIQGSAPFDVGASGGGLFDDHGQLIGILTFKARAGGPYHFAVPVEWVSDLLAHKGASRSGAVAAFWQHTDERQPTFLRAATLAARGDCAALAEVAAHWQKEEPDSLEARQAGRAASRCLAQTARLGE